MGAQVQVRKDPPSGTIVIDDLPRRNPLSRQVVEQLLEGLEDLRQERSVRAIIVTARGDIFSSGTDLTEVSTAGDEGSLEHAALWHRDAQQLAELYLACLRHPKLIIAALPGPAWGSGAGLALAADLQVATPQTSWGFPEGQRGLVAGSAIPLVAFRWGGALAAQLCVAGITLHAPQAERWGLVTDLVSPDDVWVRAHQLAEQVARHAPESLALAKRTLLETAGEELEAWLAAGGAAMATARTTAAARIGIEAFLGKVPPQWP